MCYVLNKSAQSVYPIENEGKNERDKNETEETTVRGHQKVIVTEKEPILEALEKCGWVQAKAARYLGMTVRQLNYRIAKLNIKIKKI